MTEQDYTTFCRPYDRALQKLDLDFRFFREDLQGINIQAVTTRLKSFASALAKQQEERIPIEEMQDIAGMRVIVSTEPEIDVVDSYFVTQEGFKKFKILSRDDIARNGYKARHLVLEFGWTVMLPKEAKVEVQIVTSLQHSFNSVSRAWVYKSNRKISRSWERRFLEISKAIADIDHQVSELQKELVSSASRSDPDGPLTAFSFQSIVHEVFAENVPIQEAVDSVRWLVHLGLETNGQLRTFFASERPNKLLSQWTRIAEEGENMGSVFARMSKHHFFVWWFTRGDGTETMLTMYKQTINNEQGLE